MNTPADFEPLKASAIRALGPVRPATNNTEAPKHFLFHAEKADSSRLLPSHYMIYLLLVNLLGFQDLGHFEKIAWSIPIDYNGQAFLIEFRKFGVGIFVQELPSDEPAAKDIAIRICKAVKIATPFFDWMATQAVWNSCVNVNNESLILFEKYSHFRTLYNKSIQEPIINRDNYINNNTIDISTRFANEIKLLGYNREATWFAETAIDSFFAWTEHVFIHISIFIGKISSALEVTEIAESDWPKKFQAIFPLSNKQNKILYDKLTTIRQDLRNYTAHGSFGKKGEAFYFHSNAGAIPVLLPHRAGTNKFKINRSNALDYSKVFDVIDEFLSHIWQDERKPAKLYIQNTDLPTILTMANDGTYQNAMRSTEAMRELIDRLCYLTDQATNMDW